MFPRVDKSRTGKYFPIYESEFHFPSALIRSRSASRVFFPAAGYPANDNLFHHAVIIVSILRPILIQADRPRAGCPDLGKPTATFYGNALFLPVKRRGYFRYNRHGRLSLNEKNLPK
jgi:hypothetical protein